MAKNKDYSAEAIIARAQNAAYQDQKAMGKQIQESNKQNVVTGETNRVPTNPNLVLPKQQPVKLTENAPAPKPYMAMAVTKDGMPVYGSGLQGWARKAWADLTDPVKFFYDKKKLSQERQDQITSEFEAGKKQAGLVIEDKLKWSQWGEKMFGITAEELGIIAPLGKAERDIAKDAGESAVGTAVARTARIGLDTTQNVIWGGLAILGLGDQAVRKINSTMQGIDAVADKFNRDDTDNFVEKITVNNPISVGRDIYTIAKAIATGKTTWADTKETVSKYQAGSEMVYSMVFENNARAEFEKGLAEGKDPVVLAQELGSIGIELAGSIFGDPTTYLGLSLVKPVNIFSKTAREAGNLVKVGSFSMRLPWKTIARLPEFGEIIGANVGRARLANEAQRFLSVPPEIEKVFKGITNSFGEIDAAKISRDTVKTIVARYSTKAVEPLSQMPIQKTTKFWNLSTYTADSKISIASKDASIWLQNMLAKANGVDNAFLILSDMKAIREGGVEAEEAAARLLTHGSMVFSSVGEMVGEVLTRLDKENIYDMVKKFGDNKVVLHNELLKKLGGIIDDFIPSVEEMSKAVDKVKEAKLAGLVPDERTLKLAEMYDDVPAIVKTVNKITKVPLAVAGKTSQGMVTLFMQFVPRSWSRNIQGAFLPMAARIGLFNAIDVATSATLGLDKKLTTDLLQRVDDDIFKMLDFVPMEDGIGKMVGTNKGIFKIGMLDSIKRSEMIMGRRIIAQSVRDSISNALPAVVKDLPQWDNFVSTLPKEQQALPFAALERAYGNVDEAEKILRGWIGKGEIEVWKLIEPPQALKKYLEDNGLAEAFATARDNAKSSDEFASSVQGWVDDYKKTIDNAFKNQPVTSTAFAEHGDFGMDLAKQVPEKQRETIAALYQSWHNTQKSLTNVYKNVLASADREVAKIPDEIINGVQDSTKRMNANNQLAQLKTMMDDTMDMTEAAWQRVDNIRTEFVKDIKSAKTPEEFKAMFNKVYQAGTFKFSLRDIYPTATEVTPDFVKSGGWSAFFEFASETHKTANASRYVQIMNGLEEVAKMAKSSIDEMAGGKAGDNVFNVLQTHYADAIKFEQQHAMERFFRAWDFSKEKQMANTINLKDAAAKLKTQFPNWEGNVDNFIAQVDAKDTEKTKIAKLAGKWGIPSAIATGAPLDKKLLNIVNAKAKDDFLALGEDIADFKPYKSLDEVPSGIADDAFRVHAEKNKLKPQKVVAETVQEVAPTTDEAGNLVEPLTPAVKKELTMADAIEAFKATRLAPPETGLLPTETEVLARGLKNFEGDVKRWTDAVVKEWGVKTKTIPPEQMPDFKNLWNEAKAAIKPRIDHVKLEAGVTGVSTRNFVLHDYNKTYADHALSMMLGNSFHYWTTRTYSRALETLVENPKYANMYMRYKEYNTKRHSDQPEWYRQNIQFDNVMGIPLKNPYFVNLEAAINPMYGLTGTDFNDPKKRVDWMSRTVDDMNKMGPSFSPLISWAIGMNMFRKGEQEAGQRWMGRLLPPSVLVKSASSALLGKPIEIDPFVNFLDGGVDPYERNRVAAALANMVRTGEITSEEMIEASRMKEGPIWEAGIEASATARFGSDATSFFLGAGLRPRTEDDMKIEKFWQDYGAMIASSSMMSSDQYRQQWDKMRDNPEYGMFMDALLLSRKSGDDMDTAYVYNVLSRIPPGQLNDISDIAGIRPDLLQSFYDNKGDFDRMGIPPQDRQILIGQVVNIGAILAMPNTATRQEWSIAKTQYKQMQDMLTETFGEGINELMSEYYSVPNQADWLEANPDVDAAMKLKDQIVMSNPSLNQYYGGIQVIERYYTTTMENDLMKKYGEDIKDVETEYYDLLSDAEQKAFKAAHPELKPYWKEKTAYQAEMQKKLDAIAKDLPDKPLPQLRPNVTPENVPQEQLQNMSPIPFSEWEKNLGTPITSLIQEYANGADLPRQVRSALDYEAYKYGFYDGDAMLQAIMQSLPQ